jgi:hypothetical protein
VEYYEPSCQMFPLIGSAYGVRDRPSGILKITEHNEEVEGAALHVVTSNGCVAR